MSHNRRSFALALVAACAFTACDRGNNDATVSATAVAEATAPATPTAQVSNPTGSETGTGESVGIAACDAYLTKYEACITDKVPADTRAALEAGLTQTRDAWRAAIAAGTAASDLEAACKTMSDGAKASMAAFGCRDF